MFPIAMVLVPVLLFLFLCKTRGILSLSMLTGGQKEEASKSKSASSSKDSIVGDSFSDF